MQLLTQEASISRRLSADQCAAATASQPPTVPSTSSGDAEAASARPVHRPTRSMARAADSTGKVGKAQSTEKLYPCTMLPFRQ